MIPSTGWLYKEAIKFSNTEEDNIYKIDYGNNIEREIKLIEDALIECSTALEYPAEWTALELPGNDQYIFRIRLHCFQLYQWR